MRRRRAGRAARPQRRLRLTALLEPFLPPEPTTADVVHLALWSLRDDLRVARRNLVREKVAGSMLTPKALRWWLYRASGLAIDTPNVRDGCLFRVSHLAVGVGSAIGGRCQFEGLGSITIGRRSVVARGTVFLSSHHPKLADGSPQWEPEPRPITVGDRVWIGAGSIVLPGTVIEDDCTIGAGSVVLGRLDAGGIYVGAPARRVGSRDVSTS